MRRENAGAAGGSPALQDVFAAGHRAFCQRLRERTSRAAFDGRRDRDAGDEAPLHDPARVVRWTGREVARPDKARSGACGGREEKSEEPGAVQRAHSGSRDPAGSPRSGGVLAPGDGFTREVPERSATGAPGGRPADVEPGFCRPSLSSECAEGVAAGLAAHRHRCAQDADAAHSFADP